MSTKNSFLYFSQFSPTILPLLVHKVILTNPLTLPCSIPQQFFTSLFSLTTIPIIYTKIFSLPQPFSQFRLRQGIRELGSLKQSLELSTGTVLISLFYLKVRTVITGLKTTDYLSPSLGKLVYCS